MKILRRIFFVLFIFTALISVIMIHNMIKGNVNLIFRSFFWSDAVIPLTYIAVQLAGLLVVIFSRNHILTGFFTVLTGVATVLSGGMAFAVEGAPSPRLLSVITLTSVCVSFALFLGYTVLGGLFFVKNPDKKGK